MAEDLQWKAELSRHIHSAEAMKYERRLNHISYSSVILSILIALLAFSWNSVSVENGWDDYYVWLIAVSGFLVLILTISVRLLGYDHKHSSHDIAVRLLTDFIRRAHKLRHVDLVECGNENRSILVESLRESYSQLSYSLPSTSISDEEFLLLKKMLMIKIAASKKLDNDPELDISSTLTHIKNLRRQIRRF